MKKILILYAKYGGGHLSAANSLADYIKKNYPNAEVKVLDCVESVTPFLSKVTTKAYEYMAKKAPKLWKRMYYNSSKGILYGTSEISKKYLANHLLKQFNEFKPDVVLSVHPFGSQLTAYLKQKEKINCKLATIFTDFVTHFQWLVGKEFVDYFFISNNKMKQELIDIKIPEEKIFITGVPLSCKFYSNFDNNQIYKDHNLNPNLKTILLFGGGEFGLGHKCTTEILESLTKHLDSYQVVAISGKNKKMYSTFTEIASKANNKNIHVYEYSNSVPELMHISDLVITKPGGLTTSESLASGLPMIIINPIPGQEEENAKFVENAGAGIWIKDSDNVEEIINNLLPDSNKLEIMQNNAYKIAHKNSTKDICEIFFGH